MMSFFSIHLSVFCWQNSCLLSGNKKWNLFIFKLNTSVWKCCFLTRHCHAQRKVAPVKKNIPSRKPNFPLSIEKKLTGPIAEAFQCHSMSALSLQLPLWRQLRTCIWKFIQGLPLWPIDCAPASCQRPGSSERAALKGRRGPLCSTEAAWPFQGFKVCFNLICHKTSWDDGVERFNARKIRF